MNKNPASAKSKKPMMSLNPRVFVCCGTSLRAIGRKINRSEAWRKANMERVWRGNVVSQSGNSFWLRCFYEVANVAADSYDLANHEFQSELSSDLPPSGSDFWIECQRGRR